MKKLLLIAGITICMVACAENKTTEETIDQTTTETMDASRTEAEKREKEIADSTIMLDKKLADPNDPTTPDSL